MYYSSIVLENFFSCRTLDNQSDHLDQIPTGALPPNTDDSPVSCQSCMDNVGDLVDDRYRPLLANEICAGSASAARYEAREVREGQSE